MKKKNGSCIHIHCITLCLLIEELWPLTLKDINNQYLSIPIIFFLVAAAVGTKWGRLWLGNSFWRKVSHLGATWNTMQCTSEWFTAQLEYFINRLDLLSLTSRVYLLGYCIYKAEVHWVVYLPCQVCSFSVQGNFSFFSSILSNILLC